MIRNKARQRARTRILVLSMAIVVCTGFFIWPVLADKIENTSDPDPPASASQPEKGAGKGEEIDGVSANSSGEQPSHLILVNKERGLDKDYVPDDLVPVSTTAPNILCNKLSKPAAVAFEELITAAKADGYIIKLRSGYRSYAIQEKLFNSYVKRDGRKKAEQYSATPGHSEHQTGLAADVTAPSVDYELDQSFGSTEEGKWLTENAHRFGYIVRYQDGKQYITGYIYEPWHIRYVGKDAALEIYQRNLTFEEYLGEF